MFEVWASQVPAFSAVSTTQRTISAAREKVGSSPAGNLAPFGAEQKCKALGAADHEAADVEIVK